MRRLELVFVSLWLASWIVSLLAVAGKVSLAGRLPLELYPLYTMSAAAGWVMGNIWVQRTKALSLPLARRFWALYFFGPPGILYLLRLMAPEGDQLARPMVPIYSFFVFAMLFLVPVTLRSRENKRPQLRIGGDAERRKQGPGD